MGLYQLLSTRFVRDGASSIGGRHQSAAYRRMHAPDAIGDSEGEASTCRGGLEACLALRCAVDCLKQPARKHPAKLIVVTGLHSTVPRRATLRWLLLRRCDHILCSLGYTELHYRLCLDLDGFPGLRVAAQPSFTFGLH